MHMSEETCNVFCIFEIRKEGHESHPELILLSLNSL